MGIIQDIWEFGGKLKQGKENRAAAKEERQRNLALINGLDYTPMYSSETVPTYQKTQSPVARSYLESFLMGNNPDATRRGTPNSTAIKAQQQSAQNALFGTPEARLALSQKFASTNPYKVQTPTRKVTEGSEEALAVAKYPNQADLGVTNPRLIKALEESGFMHADGVWKSPIMQGRVSQMMAGYNNDQDRIADLLEQGGWKAVQNDFRSGGANKPAKRDAFGSLNKNFGKG